MFVTEGKFVLTDAERNIIRALGDSLYTEEFLEEWLNRNDNIDFNAPAALQIMGAHGYFKAVRALAAGTHATIPTLPPENTFACGIVADALEDFLKEWTFEDRSVGIFGCSDAEKSIMGGLIAYLRSFAV